MTTTAGCTCVASIEVLMGPDAGKIVPPTDLGATHPTGVIAIGRSKKFVFGKGPPGDDRAGLLLTTDLDVSSRHAQVLLDSSTGVLSIRDCKSTNGTKLNDVSLPPDVLRPLSDGDTITAGSSLMVFRVHKRCMLCKTRSTVQPSSASIAPPSLVDSSSEEGQSSAHLTSSMQQDMLPPVPSSLAAVVESDFLPSPPRKVVEPQHNCIVCHASLWGLDSWARQEHVNACLDEAASSSKKLRRQGSTSADKHQMELAVALSRSVVGEEVECVVNRGMLEREIADIDAAIAKLQKKRQALVRKLHKNAKQTKRVAPSSILPPEIVVQWDVPAVLSELFPPSKRLGQSSPAHDQNSASNDDGHDKDARNRPTKVRRSAAATSLWRHAAGSSDDRIVLPSFAPYILPRAIPAAGDVEVPIEVQATFPEWKENLTFLQSCTGASLDAALNCLRAEMAKLDPGLNDHDAATSKAFAFFEKHMESLLRAKLNDAASSQPNECLAEASSAPSLEQPVPDAACNDEPTVLDSPDEVAKAGDWDTLTRHN